MKQKEFLELYPTITEAIENNISYINYGGCGIYAFELSKLLKEKGINHKIMIIHRHRNLNSQKEIKNYVANNNVKDFNSYISWRHIVLKVGRNYLDGLKIMRLDDMIEPFNEISEDFLVKLIKAKDWNPTFDRKQRPKIRKILKRFF